MARLLRGCVQILQEQHMNGSNKCRLPFEDILKLTHDVYDNVKMKEMLAIFTFQSIPALFAAQN